MDKLKQMLSPGHKQDDQVLYGEGEGRQQAAAAHPSSSTDTAPLHTNAGAEKKEHGVLRQILNPGGEKYDETAFGENATTAPSGPRDPQALQTDPEVEKHDHSVARQILNPGGEKYDEMRYGTTAHSSGDLGMATSGTGLKGVVGNDVQLQTDESEKKHEHSILRQILNPGGDKYDSERYGTTAHAVDSAQGSHAAPGTAGVAGTDLSQPRSKAADDNMSIKSGKLGPFARQADTPPAGSAQPSQAAAPSSSTVPQSSTGASSHTGRDAALAGTGGAVAGGALAAHEHDKHKDQAVPASSVPASSVPASSVPATQPSTVSSHQPSSTTTTNTSTYTTTNTTQPTTSQPSTAQAYQPASGQDSHVGRDAALAGTGGAVAGGALAHEHNKHKETAQPSSSQAYSSHPAQTATSGQYDPAVVAAQQAYKPSQAPTSHTGRDAALAGTGGAIAGGALTHNNKQSDYAAPSTTSQSQAYPSSASQPTTSSDAYQPTQSGTSHTARDAALAGTGGALAGGALASHERNKDSGPSASNVDQLNQPAGANDVAAATYTYSSTPVGFADSHSSAGGANAIGNLSVRPSGEGSSADASSVGVRHGQAIHDSASAPTQPESTGDSQLNYPRAGNDIANATHTDRSYPVGAAATTGDVGATTGSTGTAIGSMAPAMGNTGTTTGSTAPTMGSTGTATGSAAPTMGSTVAPYEGYYHHTSGPHPTDVGNRLDPHVPGEFPSETTTDRSTTGPTSGITGAAPLSTTTAPTTGDDKHHYGRDAALAGGAGAVGAGAYEASKSRGDTGPASKTVGPHESNVANILDPRVRPDPSKMTGSASKEAENAPPTSATAPPTSATAPSNSTTAPTSSTTAPTSSTTAPSTMDDKHHYGRDAAVAGGVGAGAGAGVYGAEHAHDEKHSKLHKDRPEESETGEKKHGFIYNLLHPGHKDKESDKHSHDKHSHDKHSHDKHTHDKQSQAQPASAATSTAAPTGAVSALDSTTDKEGAVIEPHTGLPMNPSKYGTDGAGGTDGAQQIPGYHATQSGTEGATGPDWQAIKKANTPY